MLEVARSLGALVKAGWRPQRSIVLCSWDGEEYGLLGSTAFADRHSAWLAQSAVAYLNVDIGVGGRQLIVDASPSLARLVRGATERVIDPATERPLSTVWDGLVGTLGSGSDYTAFLDRYGVASINLAFISREREGNYHSLTDSFFWMEHFGDTSDYAYHRLCAQLWGLLTLRLADVPQLPFNISDYGSKMRDYFADWSQNYSTWNHAGDHVHSPLYVHHI